MLTILTTILAFLGMAAVGWITWRLVNMQEEPAGLDDKAPPADPPVDAASPADPEGEDTGR
jgi:hypothetical protein